MITFTETAKALLNNPVLQSFYLVKIYNQNEVFRAFTTNPYNITMSDGQEYIANNLLLNVPDLKLATSVDRDEFTFEIADSNFQEATFFESSIVGKKIDVRISFYNELQLPVTNIADTFLIYSGYGNDVAYTIKTSEQGEVYAKISCTSPMADLDHKKGIYLNKEAMRNRNPLDTSCDQVYSNSKTLHLKWGKV